MVLVVALMVEVFQTVLSSAVTVTLMVVGLVPVTVKVLTAEAVTLAWTTLVIVTAEGVTVVV